MTQSGSPFSASVVIAVCRPSWKRTCAYQKVDLPAIGTFQTATANSIPSMPTDIADRARTAGPLGPCQPPDPARVAASRRPDERAAAPSPAPATSSADPAGLCPVGRRSDCDRSRRPSRVARGSPAAERFSRRPCVRTSQPLAKLHLFSDRQRAHSKSPSNTTDTKDTRKSLTGPFPAVFRGLCGESALRRRSENRVRRNRNRMDHTAR